jgi:hypothetical protein
VGAEFINDFTERKRDGLQAWMQTPILFSRKGGEQPILNWHVGFCDDRHK